MGCENQLDWILEHESLIQGPVLEVGSRIYPGSPNLREYLPGREYQGVDLEPGPGVDARIDMADEDGLRWDQFIDAGFATILCLSVLEHCAAPWQMARNISSLLWRDGLVFVSVPFAWKIHRYPKDYWRFTPDGVRALFPELDFDQYASEMTTNVHGEVRPLTDDMMACNARRCGQPQHHYHLPPTLINMIGVKK